MNYSEIAKFIGKEVLWRAGALMIRVKITDVKMSYGRTRYQIEPVSGNGSTWTENIFQEKTVRP